MNTVTVLLLVVSMSVLVFGVSAWRLTSSRSIMLNTLLGTLGLLMAAAQSTGPAPTQWTVIIPFLVTMLFGGRALGIWWRSRRQAELARPAQLMAAVAAISLTATVWAYMAL